MAEIKLYFADCAGTPSNCSYPHEAVITDPRFGSDMESFFASMKREELYRTKYRSERAFKEAVDSNIDFYNDKRPHEQ